MTQNIGFVLLVIASLLGIILFIYSLATSTAFRKSTAKFFRKIGEFIVRHWVGTIATFAIASAIIWHDTTGALCQSFGTTGIMAIGILIMLSAIFKFKGKWSKWLWRAGGIAICLVVLAALLNKLPW